MATGGKCNVHTFSEFGHIKAREVHTIFVLQLAAREIQAPQMVMVE